MHELKNQKQKIKTATHLFKVLGTNSLRRLLEFHSIAVSILDKGGSGYRTAVGHAHLQII